MSQAGSIQLRSFLLLSICISGLEGPRVTIIKDIVKEDDDFDPWEYCVTDSKEALQGVTPNTFWPRYQLWSREGIPTAIYQREDWKISDA
ncbi:hypothetical protein GGI43DRAFT_380209 [Trichoderma evansii]